jgi:hypothetical protein
MTFCVVLLALALLAAADTDKIDGCHAGQAVLPYLTPSTWDITCDKTPGYQRFEALSIALKGRPKSRSVTQRDASSLQTATVTGVLSFPNNTHSVGAFFTGATVPATGVDALGLYGLAVTANTVTLAYVGPATSGTASFTAAAFNGPVVTVLTNAPQILNAVISSASPHWAGAVLTFDATHVYLNMQSLIIDVSDTITVTLTFPALPTE